MRPPVLAVSLLAAGCGMLGLVACGSDDAEPRIEPELDYLLTRGHETPVPVWEIDESITSRPPVASRLGALGQLGAGVLVVGLVVALFIAASVVWRWVFG